MRETDVLILGGGVGGLAAGTVLGDRAVVLERNARPGGLVRTACFKGYWFDHVLHLLYFQDEATAERVKPMMGDDLAECPPEAWVETVKGTVRFPFQMHLGALDADTAERCVEDLKSEIARQPEAPPAHFEELLTRTFGQTMCDVFLHPYNRKMWKRPLDSLSTAGFTWTITHPDLEKVEEGAASPSRSFKAYNAGGNYPRPPASADQRGMEVLSQALARQVPHLELSHHVIDIDLDKRQVTALVDGKERLFGYRDSCVSTLPLPLTVSLCRQAPEALKQACRRLPINRVLTGAFSIRGPRPEGRGHWRYYSDEELCFTRLTYMHEFDPQSAPPEGWGLLTEVLERGEDPLRDPADILAEMKADIIKAGALPEGCEIIDENLIVIKNAYVVFTPESREVVAACAEFLRKHDLEPLGRYGRWEYSSMSGVMRDGFAWADEKLAALEGQSVREAGASEAAIAAEGA